MDKLKVIGRGDFSHVNLVMQSGCFAAMKVYQKAKLDRPTKLKQIKNELNIHMQIKYPFIIQMFLSMEDSHYIYYILEYAPGGDLYSLLRRHRRLNDESARFYASQIILAIEHLHGERIIFRDIKPENILVDNFGYIKLADFGMATKMVGTKTFTYCGTPEYIAPEIVLNSGHDYGVDYWALGILLFEMKYGHTPFRAKDTFQTYQNIVNKKVVVLSYYRSSYILFRQNAFAFLND